MLNDWLWLFFLAASVSQSHQFSEKDRVDCLPGQDGLEEAEALDLCFNRGCVWFPTQTGIIPGPPDCFFPPNYGYLAYRDVYQTPEGYRVDLHRQVLGQSLFGGDFKNISICWEFQTSNRLRVKIFPTSVSRYEVPIAIHGSGQAVEDTEYIVESTYEPVFSFKIIRKATGSVIFDSSLGGLTVSEQFLQIAASLPSDNVYGFAEQEQSSFKHAMNWQTLGMFARDHAPQGDINLYGVHPRYTVLETDGSAHGVLFLNSNAQDVQLTPAPGLVYRTIGGVLDVYFFLGPNPEEVVSQYTEAVGRYYLPPYWALGFHLCRWGYNSLENMQSAWQRTRDAKIPFDAQWGDIDIMDRALDFTVNPTEFAGLADFVENIHDVGMKFVTILDPCITTGEKEGTYPPFDEGNLLDIWIKNSSGAPLLAKVWPAEYCYFPDFSKEVTKDWWVKQITSFQQRLSWDGLWIDMNEPSNFVTGSVQGCPNNTLNFPPYKPYSPEAPTLSEKTICLDAHQEWGSHYDTHSMFGWSETEPTLRGVRESTGKRGLVLSRSTFIGSGRWTAHWLGDNWSQWDNLHFSIIGMLQFNQFGIPLVGADICGFINNSTEELCARWHQLGAFYPFTRNHNTLDTIDQDPGVWEGGLVAKVAKQSLELKYSLLPYLYTLFYKHTMTGSTVVRPLWHEFATDQNTYDIDTQFMWGRSIMFSPVLEAGQDEREVYVPPGANWYDIWTGQRVADGNIMVEADLCKDCDPGVQVKIPVHIRGGSVIPQQESGLTTSESRQNPMIFSVFLDDEKNAVGELYLDDGESINSETEMFSLINLEVEDGNMIGYASSAKFQDIHFECVLIYVYGVNEEVTNVMVNNAIHPAFVYMPESQSLTVFDLHLPPLEPFTIHWM